MILERRYNNLDTEFEELRKVSSSCSRNKRYSDSIENIEDARDFEKEFGMFSSVADTQRNHQRVTDDDDDDGNDPDRKKKGIFETLESSSHNSQLFNLSMQQPSLSAERDITKHFDDNVDDSTDDDNDNDQVFIISGRKSDNDVSIINEQIPCAPKALFHHDYKLHDETPSNLLSTNFPSQKSSFIEKRQMHYFGMKKPYVITEDSDVDSYNHDANDTTFDSGSDRDSDADFSDCGNKMKTLPALQIAVTPDSSSIKVKRRIHDRKYTVM